MKKNVLIVTVGTRDVQIDEAIAKQLPAEIEVNTNFGPPYSFINPRYAGEYLLTHNEYDEYLQFPIISPVIEYLAQKDKKPDYLLLVVTNQTLADERYRKNDTVHYGFIIEKKLSEIYPEIEFDNYELGFNEDVANLDALYTHFGKQRNDLLLVPPDQVSNVYLLPQGGIDQINMALTLKLTEHFRDKVSMLQITEEGAIHERNFTRHFLKNLDSQKFQFLVSNYYYDSIHLLLSESIYKADGDNDMKLLRPLVAFCHHKVNLNMQMAATALNEIRNKYPEEAALLFKNDYIPGNNKLEPYVDLYLSCKMAYGQQNYKVFMQGTYALFENILRYIILSTDELEDLIIANKKSTEHKLNYKHTFYNELQVYCEVTSQKMNEVLRYRDYQIILDYYLKSGHSLNEHFLRIYKLRDFFNGTAKNWRNETLHGMRPINKSILDQIFNSNGKTYTVNQLFDLLDPVFEVQGFGIYEKINAKIISLL